MSAEVEQDPARADSRMNRAIHTVEKEFGVCIDENYNYIKLLSQLDFLSYREKQRRIEEKRARRRKR